LLEDIKLYNKNETLELNKINDELPKIEKREKNLPYDSKAPKLDKELSIVIKNNEVQKKRK